MTDTKNIETQRNQVADSYYQGYQFGREVEDHSGWECSSDAPDEMTRPVFLKSLIEDEDHEEYGSEKVYFTVVFKPGTSYVVDAYAIDKKGNIFGEIPPMTEGVVEHCD